MDFRDTKRKWRVLLELSNNKISYDVVTMKELMKFIRKERQKSGKINGRVKPMTPVESWLLDIAFSRFKETFKGTRIISAEIQQVSEE